MLAQVAPSSLDILFGIVEKRHDLLEQKCRDLDKVAHLLSKHMPQASNWKSAPQKTRQPEKVMKANYAPKHTMEDHS